MRAILKQGITALSAIFAIGLAAAQPAKADVLNGSFETGDYTSWTTTSGNLDVLGNFYKTPANGSFQAVLSNGANSGQGVAGTSNLAITNIPSLDTFFNVGSGTLEGLNVKSGTGIKQSFFATAGDVVSFQYDFATNAASNGNADFAFYALHNDTVGGNASVSQLANVATSNSATNINFDIFNDFSRETGYQPTPFTFTIATTGNYTLAFGVTNVVDTAQTSGLLIDSVSVAAAPLPSAAWGGMALFSGLGMMQYSRRRKAVVA